MNNAAQFRPTLATGRAACPADQVANVLDSVEHATAAWFYTRGRPPAIMGVQRQPGINIIEVTDASASCRSSRRSCRRR